MITLRISYVLVLSYRPICEDGRYIREISSVRQSGAINVFSSLPFVYIAQVTVFKSRIFHKPNY